MSVLPELRRDLVLVEQTYRGERSFIIKDPQSHKYFRFRPAEIMVIQALDGVHTAVQVAAALAEEGLRVSAAGVDTFARKLATMGLCERTLSERSIQQMERLRAERRRRLKPSALKGDVFRLRWSAGDPDQLFNRWLPRLRFFFTRTFLQLSVALFAIYFLVLAVKWPEFSNAVVELYSLNFTVATLAVFWFTGVVIIAIHELGHGLTCKYFGGQVHEIGAMLIYFEPAFFCNVNDAWTFPELRARLWVTAAGSWIQLVIASIAALVWWAAAPGTLIYDVAFAAMLIGGITTVFVNLNPLIPLDGYYALSDYLEVPNLRQRAFAHLAWLIKARILRLDLPAPPADPREQRVFLIYSGLAVIYIALLLSFFAATAFGWLSRWLGGLGVALFMAWAFVMLRSPARALIRTMAMTLRQHQARWRESHWRGRLSVALPAVIIIGILVPWRITVTGPFVAAPVLSLPHTAPDSGVIIRVQAREGAHIPGGSPLLQIRNLEMERELVAGRRVVDSLRARSAQARGQGRMADVAILDAERSVEDARVAGLSARLEALRIRALGRGVVVTPRPEELVGLWVRSGELVLALERTDSIEIRIALHGAGGTLVQPGAPARLLPDATLLAPVSARVAAVSVSGSPTHDVEGRLRLPAGKAWRPGMTGRASITLRRSNAWGALWWSIRRGLRSDILL